MARRFWPPRCSCWRFAPMCAAARESRATARRADAARPAKAPSRDGWGLPARAAPPRARRPRPSCATIRGRVPTTPDALRIGGFVPTRELGHGGMGLVFAARHDATGQLAALKLVTDARSCAAAGRTELQREVQAAARLHHP